MNRRSILKIGAGACVGFTLAGCVGDEEGTVDTETTTSGGNPEEVVQQFVDAVDQGDQESLDQLVHSEGEIAGETGEYAERGGEVEVSSVDTETVAQADKEAFVDTEIEYQDQESDDSIDTILYELQKEGSWRIYRESANIPLKYRLEDTTPADSFETTIGLSEPAAEPFFNAKEVAAVDIQDHYQDDDIVLVSLSFSDDKADQMQQTATDLGSDLQDAQIFQYLEDELVKTSDVSEDLAYMMQTGNWDGSSNMSYTDRDLAERVAKTVLTQVDD